MLVVLCVQVHDVFLKSDDDEAHQSRQLIGVASTAAEAEASLPGEGTNDWGKVKDFFSTAVAALLVPPTRPLSIQGRIVDVQSLEVAQRKQRPTKRKVAKRRQRRGALASGRPRP